MNFKDAQDKFDNEIKSKSTIVTHNKNAVNQYRCFDAGLVLRTLRQLSISNHIVDLYNFFTSHPFKINNTSDLDNLRNKIKLANQDLSKFREVEFNSYKVINESLILSIEKDIEFIISSFKELEKALRDIQDSEI